MIGNDISIPCAYLHSHLTLPIPSNRTLVPLQYPPHTIALGCIYLTALLMSADPNASASSPSYDSREHSFRRDDPAMIVATLAHPGEWETKFFSRVEHLEGMHPLIETSALYLMPLFRYCPRALGSFALHTVHRISSLHSFDFTNHTLLPISFPATIPANTDNTNSTVELLHRAAYAAEDTAARARTGPREAREEAGAREGGSGCRYGYKWDGGFERGDCEVFVWVAG